MFGRSESVMDRYARESRKRMKEYEETAQRRQRKYEKSARKRQAAMDASLRRSQKEQQARSKSWERERQERDKRWEKERRARDKQLKSLGNRSIFSDPILSDIFGFQEEKKSLFARRKRREQAAQNVFSAIFGEDYLQDLLNQIRDSSTAGFGASYEPHTQPREEKAQPQVSAAEQARLGLMVSLPQEKLKTFINYDETLVRSFIATVQYARSPGEDGRTPLSDWEIHLRYRRAIEVTEPDPMMVEKTRLSNLLLEGTRAQAHYLF
jgi:hypothetical protein